MASEIVAAGVAVLDHISIVKRTPDGWEECQAPFVQGGGLMASAAVAAARLGAGVALWAVLGDDYHGEKVRGELARYGVGVDQIKLEKGRPTPTSYITTGCGDAFHGAYAYAMTRSWDVHQAIRFSSAVSAIKATRLGGRTGLPTLEEVTQFLAERPDQGRASRHQG